MDEEELEQRRTAALEALQDTVDQLGPITDATRGAIREPVLELIDRIYEVGEELEAIRFDVYDGGRLRTDVE